MSDTKKPKNYKRMRALPSKNPPDWSLPLLKKPGWAYESESGCCTCKEAPAPKGMNLSTQEATGKTLRAAIDKAMKREAK